MGELDIRTREDRGQVSKLNSRRTDKPIEDTFQREEGATLTVSKLQNIVIIIPAFNEDRFIGSVVMKSHRFATTVIVVDDGSTDDTADIADECGAVVIRMACNQGKGAALKVGFQLAAQYNPDVVATLDADGQHRPEELVKVTEPVLAGRADIVIGSRYLDNSSNVPNHRILGHKFFNLLTRFSSGVKSTDSQSGYRAFSPAAIEKIDFSSTGFSVESEMQFIAHQNNLRLVEVPITILYTDKPKRSVIAQGLYVLNGILRLVGQYRPLLFFTVPGAAILAFGILFGMVVVDIYSRVQTLAVGYAMISVLLSIIGMLLISTGVILHSVRGLLLDFKAGSKK